MDSEKRDFLLYFNSLIHTQKSRVVPPVVTDQYVIQYYREFLISKRLFKMNGLIDLNYPVFWSRQ